MSITEQQRRLLFERLSEAIGVEAASVMAELLPFHPSAELVTRSDLAATTTMLRGEMSELRADIRVEMSDLRQELRAEMSDLRQELRGEMSDLREDFGELRAEFTELKGHFIGFRGEMKGEFYRWGAAIVGANTVAVATALLS